MVCFHFSHNLNLQIGEKSEQRYDIVVFTLLMVGWEAVSDNRNLDSTSSDSVLCKWL